MVVVVALRCNTLVPVGTVTLQHPAQSHPHMVKPPAYDGGVIESQTVVPVFNLALGLVGFTVLWFRTARRKSEYPREVFLGLTLTLALFFALLCVSAEMIVLTDVPLLAASVVTVVKVYALVVLWFTRDTKYRTGTRSPDGDPHEDENRDVA